MRLDFRQRAFTLIELLVVIAIIAILAAILFPVFSSAKVAAHKTASLSQMRQLAIGLQFYLQDNEDTFMPSTNYDTPLDHPNRIWTNPLLSYIKDKSIFVAPAVGGSKYAESWANRHEQSIGLNDTTAFARTGLPPDRICANGELRLGCSAFSGAANASQMEETSRTGMLAVTPHGSVGSRYRGYVFGADNGTHLRPDFTTFTDLKQAVPLASDRDLVQELSAWDPNLLKPIFARYGATGRDEGTTPIVFADCHAKSYRAQAIKTGASGIIWRFR